MSDGDPRSFQPFARTPEAARAAIAVPNATALIRSGIDWRARSGLPATPISPRLLFRRRFPLNGKQWICITEPQYYKNNKLLLQNMMIF
jgi:hypothetical protein